MAISGFIQVVGGEREFCGLDNDTGRVRDILENQGVDITEGQTYILNGAQATLDTLLPNGFSLILPKKTAAGDRK